jgi:hypothetical protein
VPGPVSAIRVLDPGYTVQTYVTYECPLMPLEVRDLAFDRYCNLYLSQWQSYPDKGALFRVTTDKKATKWLDSFATPRRLCWAGGTRYGDYLYLTDGTLDKVFRIDLNGSVSSFADVPGIPQSLAVDTKGNYGGLLYVALRSRYRLRRIHVCFHCARRPCTRSLTGRRDFQDRPERQRPSV